jgi:hypothetical protein
MNRILFLIHRWLGLGFGLLVTFWFGSGFVMMYVGFPNLTAVERAAGLPPLPVGGWRETPAETFSARGPTNGLFRVRLGEFLGRTVYRLQEAPGAPWQLVRAHDAQPLAPVTAAEAVTVARNFTGGELEVLPRGELELDQWTVSAGLDPFRPLHRLAVRDAAGTELYVSARSGEVVRDTGRTERRLNYAGAVTHWIYPAWLRRHTAVWRNTLRVLSGIALLIPLTGLLLAIRRWALIGSRIRGVRRWHALLGLFSGLFMLTWLFSGFLSLRWVGVFDDGEPTRSQREIYAGGSLDLTAFDRSPAEAFADLPGGIPQEAELVQFAGRPYYLVGSEEASRRLVSASRTARDSGAPAPGDLRAQAAKLLPDHRLTEFLELTGYDSHYYSRRPGEDPKPLPIWRACFDDDASTWFHLDPRSGQLKERLTKGARTYRWLFNGLHSFDWPGLAFRRPLWDAVMLAILTAGLVTCLLGLRLVWQLRRSVIIRTRPPIGNRLE